MASVGYVDLVITEIVFGQKVEISTIDHIRATWPNTKILVLTACSVEYLLQAVSRSIHGYLTKASVSRETFAVAVMLLCQEEIAPITFRAFECIGELLAKRKDWVIADHNITLSDDEMQLLKVLPLGFTIEEESRRLAVSPRTVERRRHRLFEKLQAQSDFDAGVRASKMGLV